MQICRKDFDPKAAKKPLKILTKEKGTIEGQIISESGYLVVAEYFNFVKEIRQPLYSDDCPREGPPILLQGDNIIYFSNQFGDGIFDIYSTPRRIYVTTDLPVDFDKLRKRLKSRKEIYDPYSFEGVVGIGSGTAGIADPVTRPLKTFIDDNIKPDIDKGEYFTILKVGGGTYACRFVDNNRRLSIRRVAT